MTGRPLAGVRVAVTRARGQAEDLAAPLRALGADVLIAPLIRIAASIDSEAVRGAVLELPRYSWVVFSSANAVELFVEAMRRWGTPLSQLATLRIACVGPATAAAAARLGLTSEVIPEQFVGDALADALTKRSSLEGSRVLLPRAGGAREQLPQLLRARGAAVSDVELYRSVPDANGATLLRSRVRAGGIDVLTFTSGSTVRYFAEGVGEAGGVVIAVIGPVTAEIAHQYGMQVSIEADPHTVRGLVDAMVGYYHRNKRKTEE